MKTIDNILLKKIKDIYTSLHRITLAGEDGEWVRLADFGSELSKKGIRPIDYGYDKLKNFIKATNGYVIYADKTKKPPVMYLRLASEPIQTENHPIARKKHTSKIVVKGNNDVDESNVSQLENLYSLPEIGKYYKKLIEDSEISWPEIVGFYEINDKGEYQISDIRDSLFHEHKYPATDDLEENREIIIKLDGPINTLKINTYYRFNWIVTLSNDTRGYVMDIDRTVSPKRIDPRGLTEKLHQLWDDRAHGTAMNTAMETISSELMASSDGTFIYELLQNANDYPLKDQNGKAIPVEVEFHLTDKYLVCRHTGAQFTPRDVASICSIGNGSKTKNKNAIGYKGIGFKTVFHAHDWVYVKSGNYMFRFDKSKEKEGRPFQIMPLWTTIPELAEMDDTIANLVKEGSRLFNVQTVMLPRKYDYLYGMDKDQESEKSHEYVLRDIFKDIRDIIFIPNIKSVKVFFPGEEPIICEKGESLNWAISEAYQHKLDEKTERSLIISECNEHPERRIPPKYKTFDDTYVSFAAKKKDNVLISVDNATVNCYLPTKAEFGFPFLMNTDMVPSGDRNQLKTDVKFNQLFAKIAGNYFVKWLNQLLSDGFTPESVFDLIPDFDKAKSGVGKQYSLFIEEFEKGFKESLQVIPIIPVEGNSNLQIPGNVIRDVTGFATQRVIDQSLFRTLTNNGDKYLPIKAIGRNPKLIKILNESSDCTCFKEENLQVLFNNPSFQIELAKPTVNTKVIEFILDYKYRQNYYDKALFINHITKKLSSSSSLYFDIDKDRELLSSFESQISFLSTSTRDDLKDDSTEDCNYLEKIQNFKWASYKAYDSIIKPLFETNKNKDENLSLLKVEKTNLDLFSFVVKHRINNPIVKAFPILLADNSWGTLMNTCFFHDDEALTIQSQNWVDKTWYSVLSDKYVRGTDSEKKTIKDHFSIYGVLEFSKVSLYNTIIKGDTTHIDSINQKTQADFSAFSQLLLFLYSIKDEKETGTFNHFSLPVIGKGNKKLFKTGKESTIFLHDDSNNNQLLTLLDKSWVCEDWAYVLDSKCTDSLSTNENDDVVKFLKDKFLAKVSSTESFCKHVVVKNLSSIVNNIAPIYQQDNETEEVIQKRIAKEKDNTDFFKFVCDNYSFIFSEGNNPFHSFGYPFFVSNTASVKNKPAKYYRYSTQANDAAHQSWLPEGLLGVILEKYSKITSGSPIEQQLYLALNAEEFSYSSFLKNDVYKNKSAIEQKMVTIDLNVAFHKYFKDNRDKFAKEERLVLKDFPVYVMAEEGRTKAISSTGHHVSNKEVDGFIHVGFASADKMDIIPSVYFDEKDADKEYWIDILENKEYTFKEIAEWFVSKGASLISNKIQDLSSNIVFWRLVKAIPGSSNKDNQKSLISLRIFPIYSKYIKNSEPKVQVLNVNQSCYVSDSYFVGNGGIEYMLSEYAKDSYIVLGNYLEDNKDETILSWKKFWESAGFLSSNEELILNTIIPNLDKPENINEKVPLLLFQNKAIIDKHLSDTSNPESVKKLKADLNNLHVESKGGLLSISSVVFIKQNEYSPLAEPMPYFPLLSQIKDYSAEQKKFFFSIGERANCKVVSDKDTWILEKINQFVHLQSQQQSEEEGGEIKPIEDKIHYDFIRDLANWWNSINTPLYSPWIKGIKLYDNEGHLCSVSSLTEGSAYTPYCDFQSCSISTKYISDKYSTYKGILPLLNDMGIHHTFKENDIDYLSNKKFALYFWNTYLSDPKSRENVSEMIQEGLFNDVPCIPVIDGVKKAEELYNIFEGNGKENLSAYVNLLKDSGSLRPDGIFESFLDPNDNKEYPNPICGLAFIDKLSKDHCFEYLLNSKVENVAKRRYVLALLFEYYSKGLVTDVDLNTYCSSPNANWLNGKKQSKHISSLYAIGRQPEDKYFLRHFGNDPLIINNDTIADDDDIFESICSKILRLTVLHGGDNSNFITKPSDDNIDESIAIRNILKHKSLLLSTVINAPEGENWHDAYNQYLTKIDSLHFIKCSDITISCQTDPRIFRKDVDDFYFDNATKTFYYLNDWQDRFVFSAMFKNLVDVLQIPGKDDERTVMRILNKDLSVSEEIRMFEDYCTSFFNDEKFVDLLNQEFPEVINKLNFGKSQEFDEEGNKKLVGFSQERQSQEEKDSRAESERNTRTDSIQTQDNLEDATNNPPLNQVTPQMDLDEKEQINDSTPKNDDTPVEQEEGESRLFQEDEREVKDVDITPEKTNKENLSSNSQLLNERSNGRSFYDPKPSTKEQVKRLKSHGITRTLEEKDATKIEIDQINNLLGTEMTAEEIADTNYIVRKRLYQDLNDKGYYPLQNELEFIKHNKSSYELKTGDRYIHVCSATYGILYISPSIWNKLRDKQCIVCVSRGKKSNQFFYIETLEELLTWVDEDDILIKLTGEDKSKVVNTLYSECLNIETGTAYTMIRIASNAIYDSVFEPLMDDPEQTDSLDEL